MVAAVCAMAVLSILSVALIGVATATVRLVRSQHADAVARHAAESAAQAALIYANTFRTQVPYSSGTVDLVDNRGVRVAQYEYSITDVTQGGPSSRRFDAVAYVPDKAREQFRRSLRAYVVWTGARYVMKSCFGV